MTGRSLLYPEDRLGDDVVAGIRARIAATVFGTD
jgi:hypothetical protein